MCGIVGYVGSGNSTEFLSPINPFVNVDLPTLGRPTIAAKPE